MNRRYLLLSAAAYGLAAYSFGRVASAAQADSEGIELLVVPETTKKPYSRKANRTVCQKHKLGWLVVPPRQSKLEFPSLTLRCRDLQAHAYAVVCGPYSIIDGIIDTIAECCRSALKAATLVAIIGNPHAAGPVFAAAFKICLIEHIGNDAEKVRVDLVVETETTDWGPC